MIDAASVLLREKLTKPLTETPPTITFAGANFGLYLPNPHFWNQALVLFILEQFFAALLACVVYYTIIPNRGTAYAYLIGFGIVCPLCLFSYSFWILDLLDIQNRVLRFSSFAILPVITTFHAVEAMFGFSPHSVEASLSNYVWYTVCGFEIEFDRKTQTLVKSSWKDIQSSIKAFLQSLLLTGLYSSMFRNVHYEPFDADEINANISLWSNVLNSRLFLNNVVSTIYIQLYLTAFIDALSMSLTIFYRVKVKKAMNNPTLLTTSPSDFWGNRWNLVIHGTLKRGVFKPVYKYSNKAIALWATFIASGLFHEYIFYGLFIPMQEGEDLPPPGRQTAFFLWNAIILSLEHTIGHYHIFQWISQKLPRPVVTVLVISTVMPVAHWFLHPYTKVTFFEHADYGFPILVPMS